MAKRDNFPPADFPPVSETLTDYDRAHFPLYCLLLDEVADGATWDTIPPWAMGIDPLREPELAERLFKANLVRAYWMTKVGYKALLGDETDND
jgi:hypothetical protein